MYLVSFPVYNQMLVKNCKLCIMPQRTQPIRVLLTEYWEYLSIWNSWLFGYLVQITRRGLQSACQILELPEMVSNVQRYYAVYVIMWLCDLMLFLHLAPIC